MVASATQRLEVPFFRPSISEAEIEEVVACLRSGWLTTGPRTRRFENDFAESLSARHALAVNSCTAALHLAVEALGLSRGQAVLVPTMTFAATAEVIHYQGANAILVDCDPVTLHLDFHDAQRKLDQVRAGHSPLPRDVKVVGIIPVHVGGLLIDLGTIHSFAASHGLWVVEDAAHALPAATRPGPDDPWRFCGHNTSAVTCFSFYTNKTMTVGEGGMAVTDDDALAGHMRQMSLHGLSHDAWNRYRSNGTWDYRILAPGYKYNMTDIAASLGIHQLRRAEAMRQQREAIAQDYRQALGDLPHVELPCLPPDRIHAWHLFPIRLCLDRLTADRNTFVAALRERKIGCSVHWRPLHLHPYYQDRLGWSQTDFPAATAVWQRLVSLPIFPGMSGEEQHYVIETIRELCTQTFHKNRWH